MTPALTTQRCEAIRHEAAGRRRLRSRYVVVYRYRDGRIVRQEVCYDPSAPPERLPRITDG